MCVTSVSKQLSALQVVLTLQTSVWLTDIPGPSPGMSQRTAGTCQRQRCNVLYPLKHRRSLEAFITKKPSVPPVPFLDKNALPSPPCSISTTPTPLEVRGGGAGGLGEGLRTASQEAALLQWTKGSGHPGLEASQHLCQGREEASGSGKQPMSSRDEGTLRAKFDSSARFDFLGGRQCEATMANASVCHLSPKREMQSAWGVTS